MKNTQTQITIRSFIKLNLIAALLAMTAFCARSKDSAQPPPPVKTQDLQRVSVMTFNVENLFDTKHDEGKEDFAYLPLSEKSKPEIQAFCDTQGSYKKECKEMNWDDALLDRKLNNVADAILSVNNGQGPDVLLLEEVENINVLRLLNQKLAAANYQTVELIEGPDVRGIDPGLLSRLPLASAAKNNQVPPTIDSSGAARPTRDILQVPLKLPDGSVLQVFVGHFPSQSNSREARQAAHTALQDAIGKVNPQDFVIAGGDWNSTSDETDVSQSNPVSIFNWFMVNGWKISTYLCKGCEGTEYYKPKNSWSFLDVLTFDPKLSKDGSSWQLDVDSIKIQNSGKEQSIERQGKKYPKRFFASNGTGVSDHWAMYAEITHAK